MMGRWDGGSERGGDEGRERGSSKLRSLTAITGGQMSHPAGDPPDKQLKLSDLFMKQGMKGVTVTKCNVGAPVNTRSMLQVVEQQVADEALSYFEKVKSDVPNGSRDIYGKLRANVGGRPRKAVQDKAGVDGLTAKSNRPEPGAKPRRLEIGGLAQLRIVEDVKKRFRGAAGDQEALTKAWASLRRDYPDINKKRFKRMLAAADDISKRVCQERLGAGRGVTGRSKGVKVVVSAEAKITKGCRRSGGGVKFGFNEILIDVKLWHDAERRMGHQLDKADIYFEFKDRLVYCAQKLRSKDSLTKDEADKLKKYDEKLKNMESHKEAIKRTFTDRLCAKMGVKLLTPQRYSQLTSTEEKVRGELTWQQFDERMYLAAFGSEAELASWVADPGAFVAHRGETWLVFSDQIPFWVKIGMMKVLYAAWELRRMSARRLKRVKAAAKTRPSQRLEAIEDEDGDVEEVDGAADDEDGAVEEVDGAADKMEDGAAGEMEDATDDKMEGLTQKRGSDPAGEKCRITFEARQAVKGYFNGDSETGGEDVQSVILPSILVVKGAYARLSNIAGDHTFISHEVFWVGDQKIERFPGQSTKGLMRSYVELRKREPELFRDLVVFQQPAAYMDEITATWAIEDLGKRCPQAVHQRDLFASTLSDTCKKAMQLCQTIPTWIASKMTPILQLTDTDIAFALKAAAARAKSDLMREMRLAAQVTRERCSFHCSTREIILIASQSHKAIVELNARNELVLKGLRRNAMLAWRPDLSRSKFYDPSKEKWLQGQEMGSHRMKSSWLDDRMKWLDAAGKPVRADWSRSEQATCEADLAEADYVDSEFSKLVAGEIKIGGKVVHVPEIILDCDSQDLFTDVDVLNQMHPKVRKLLEKKFAATVDEDAPRRKAARAAQKFVEKERVQKALTELNESWRAFLDSALVKQTRAQVLSELQPGVAGKRKKKQQKKGKIKMVRQTKN